jgi:hypothetical protein
MILLAKIDNSVKNQNIKVDVRFGLKLLYFSFKSKKRIKLFIKALRLVDGGKKISP